MYWRVADRGLHLSSGCQIGSTLIDQNDASTWESVPKVRLHSGGLYTFIGEGLSNAESDAFCASSDYSDLSLQSRHGYGSDGGEARLTSQTSFSVVKQSLSARTIAAAFGESRRAQLG